MPRPASDGLQERGHTPTGMRTAHSQTERAGRVSQINGEETCLSVFPMVPKFLAAAASYVCPF